MTDRFLRAFAVTHGVEGGNVDDPKDPGGRTGQGVTQARYDQHRASIGQPSRDVYLIERDEVLDIYRTYWDMAGCDQLPDGVALMNFDASLNSGPSRAVKILQEAAGMPEAARDGIVGPATLRAVYAQDIHALIVRMREARLAFMKRLKNWSHNKNGWPKRLDAVTAAAMTFAGGRDPAPVSSPVPIAAQRGDVSITAAAEALAKSKPALVAGTSFLGAIAGIAKGGGPVPWAIAAALVIGAVVGAVWLVRGQMSKAAA